MTETLQTPVRELTTGSTFAGRYQVIEELGHGGMGRVYKVQDTDIKEKVALKLLRPEITLDKEAVERFSNELKLARKISHRNVCRMFDLGRAEGTTFITMEFVPGEDLKSFIHRSKHLSIGTAISIAKQVCEGLEEAHRLGVVHRDLKPGNIMIDKDGDAKIMDFGIARSLSGKGITGAGVLIGTPEYMSPEQVEGKDIDQRSDLYSLGVILYEMVTGRLPFAGDTPLSVAHKHKYEAPEDPKKLNPNIPAGLSGLILKCLEKDKSKRYQNAADVRSELENIEKGIPTTQRVIPEQKPITSREITVKLSLKKLIAPVLMLTFIVLVVVAYWLFVPKKHALSTPAQKRSIAVLPFADLSQAKDYEYLCDGISDTLINALTKIDGLWVPARTSAFFFKGKTQDIREIGQKLGVDNVLEGSVQVAGDNLRVTARISNVKDGRQVWSEIYNQKMADIFTIQDGIAQAIVVALKIKLLDEKGAPVVKHSTENREAYGLYMQGIYFYNKRGRENLEKAVEYYQEAVRRDPNYSLAFAQLAETYQTIGVWGYLPPKEAFPAAMDAARRALNIDSSLAEAHSAAAMVRYFYDWDRAASEKEFKLAIALNPNYAIAHKGYGQFLGHEGRFEEAISETRRARELDPLSPMILCATGFPLESSRRYDQAIEIYKKVLEMDPSFMPAEGYLHRAILRRYLKKGAYEEALRECQKSNDKEGMGIVFAKLGRPQETKRILEDFISQSKQNPDLSFDISTLFFALGERDTGFAWLEKAFEYRHRSMLTLINSPYFDNVRDDPRFKAMLKKIGFEEE
jgi:serine/threonine protein kinase/Tfp pilus assembly protein PilF